MALIKLCDKCRNVIVSDNQGMEIHIYGKKTRWMDLDTSSYKDIAKAYIKSKSTNIDLCEDCTKDLLPYILNSIQTSIKEDSCKKD